MRNADWISVKDRLPETGEEVWVWVKYLRMKGRRASSTGTESWIDRQDGTWAMGSAKNFKVTHWQPLPDAPAPRSKGMLCRNCGDPIHPATPAELERASLKGPDWKHDHGSWMCKESKVEGEIFAAPKASS
jgi:hypothetical protein